MAKVHYHLNLNLDELSGWYHPCDTTFAVCGGGGITRMIPLARGKDSNGNPP